MNEEFKHYYLIPLKDDNDVHDVLINWKYQGISDFKGMLITGSENEIDKMIIEAMDGYGIGILFELSSYNVVEWNYKILSNNELYEREILD